jgi:hypothetical protein
VITHSLLRSAEGQLGDARGSRASSVPVGGAPPIVMCGDEPASKAQRNHAARASTVESPPVALRADRAFRTDRKRSKVDGS